MDQHLAERLSRQLRISPEQISREEHELLLLEQVMASDLGDALVLKGGTALRLAYGSPRFSDDLDFSALPVVPEEAFSRMAEGVARALPQLVLVEALPKRFSHFALYRVKEPYLRYPFSIKVEVSTRPEPWNRETDLALRLLTSPVTPVSVLARVATLEKLWSDKQEALAGRGQPRDLYDLWFIAQKLRRPFSPDLTGIDPQVLRRELRKYLPADHWPVIDQWTE